MRKGNIIYLLVGLFFLVFASSSVLAVDESFITINITYFDNYDPDNATRFADMSDRVFVGNDSNATGQGNVRLFLTNNKTAIVDSFSSWDVPGMHVARGKDSAGNFVEFNFFGYNHIETKEVILFNVQFGNALIKNVTNSTTDEFEYPVNGSCGAIIGDPQHSKTDDEYNVSIGGSYAEFCTVTDVGGDRVRLYYEYKDTTAPDLVSDVRVDSRTRSTIKWIWDNPSNDDFYQNLIYIDGRNVANTTSNSYRAEDLDEDTSYRIEIRTIDLSGNINSGVSHSARTDGDNDDEDDDFVFEDDYFIQGQNDNNNFGGVIFDSGGDGTIVLSGSSRPASNSSINLIAFILMFAIFVLLVLILLLVVLRKGGKR